MSRSVTGIHPEAAIAPSECLKLLRIVGRLPCARKRRSTYRLTGVRSQGAEQTFKKSAWGLYRATLTVRVLPAAAIRRVRFSTSRTVTGHIWFGVDSVGSSQSASKSMLEL
ncbi:MAG: hypothetical protein QOD93_1833 [Acetobacteraceae bacterium]|nr:hypothetical protein [Acetobacteraceae bacterium]